jgi:DNA-binding LytR/AlgR family response regulator
MEVLIIEDEQLAAERLANLLKKFDPAIQIVGQLDSVEESVEWLRTRPAPQLLMMDIRLSDGLSFDIFRQATISSPIIFTTAYDQYAIQAFKVTSIDYLLKPIAYPELCRAMEKLRLLTGDAHASREAELLKLTEAFSRLHKTYKSRFLVRYGDRLQFRNAEEVAYFYADGKVVYLVTHDNRRFIVDYTLEQLEELLDPRVFYRVNRKFTAQIGSVRDIRSYHGSRLKLQLNPVADTEVLVSRERVADFKAWLDQ